MELKSSYHFSYVSCCYVLIAPLWNWNIQGTEGIQGDIRVLIAPLWNWNRSICNGDRFNICSNRTFMELKCTQRKRIETQYRSSNRTFMELKSPHKAIVLWSIMVLIAPLWNWNYSRVGQDYENFTSSNRTFMELKYGKKETTYHGRPVLIAPLWNWNQGWASKILPR